MTIKLSDASTFVETAKPKVNNEEKGKERREKEKRIQRGKGVGGGPDSVEETAHNPDNDREKV